MKIIGELSELKHSPVSFTLGSYDGLHKGHVKLLEKLKSISSASGTGSLLISFYPHPRKVVDESYDMKLLNTREEKIRIVGELGIDYIHFINFTKEFSGKSHGDFYEDYIFSDLNVKNIVAGSNHHFGSGRKGDNSVLAGICAKRSVGLLTLPPVLMDGISISSTRIRHSIQEGRVDEASRMLGYDYSLTGTVVKGKGAGSRLGYPTANLDIINIAKVIPANGVYATTSFISGRTFRSVTNVGTAPTLGGSGLSIETHIPGLDSDIYGLELTVSFVKRLRDEKVFGSEQELKDAVSQDTGRSLELLSGRNGTI